MGVPIYIPPPKIYILTAWITTFACTILQAVLCIYHVVSSKKKRLHSLQCSWSAFKKQPSLYTSYILSASGFVLPFHTILWNASQTWPATKTQCIITLATAPLTYTLFKEMLYITLVLRIYGVFNGTGMAYSTKKVLIPWITFITIWNLCNSIIINGFGNEMRVENGVCVFLVSQLMNFSFVAADIIAFLVNTYLFLRPIIALSKISKLGSNKDNDINKQLKKVAIKQFILSCIASGSTILDIVLATLFWLHQVWACLDVVLTTFSIILMYKWNDQIVDKLFHICCICCIPCTYCCKKQRKSDQDIKSLEITVTQHSSSEINTGTGNTVVIE
eukprot:UN01857